MRDKGIFLDLTPTSYNHFLLKITQPSIVLSAASRSARATADASHNQLYDQLVQRVLKSGVKFAAGTDMCWYWPGKTCGQASITTLLNLHAAGMPALGVIRAITINAAEMLGWQDRIGAYRAWEVCGPWLPFPADPVADITELERLRFVMKNGEVVRNEVVRNELASH